jgi:hypothetical protein
MHWTEWHKIEDAIHKGEPSDASGNCFFCRKEVDGMFYCFGCKEFICGDCDHRDPMAMGRHKACDHRA